MRYLDQYVRMAAENFEKELARVAMFDEHAKEILESPQLQILLRKIKGGEITPPSNSFDGFDQLFYTDAKFCNSWASDLCYKKNETKLFSAVAALSYTLRNFHSDIDFAGHCRLTDYVFPDGWPNNPELFAETVRQAEQEAKTKTAQAAPTMLKKFKQWLSNILNS